MFGLSFGKGEARIVAVADIGSADAGVALLEIGEKTRAIAAVREGLPLEERSQDALGKGVVQCLASAGEKALAQLASTAPKAKISSVLAVVGAPWTRSVSGEAVMNFPEETAVAEKHLGELGTLALENRKDIDRAKIFEASVVRVLLNGYATSKPVGKRARQIRVRALLSECDPTLKRGVQDALGRLFPGMPVVWRSSARAALSLARRASRDTCLIAEVGTEATDLLVVRKGDLEGRMLIPSGVRSIATSFAKGKPVEETLALLDMLEKDQCESDACDALQDAMAKAEPELAQRFGETFAKLSVGRRLPEELLLVAPGNAASWLGRFFSRIDFTQFTATTRPFDPSAISEIPDLSSDPRIAGDAGFAVVYALVNSEPEALLRA